MSSISDNDESRRRFLIAALAGGFLGVTGCMPVAQMASGRSIFKLEGDVRINNQLASMDSAVRVGDEIQTGNNSYIIFVIGSNSHILRSNSRMTVGATGRQPINLASGKLLSVFAPGRPLELATPTAVVSIRGTGLYMESEPERSYVCTCYGSTTIGVAGAPAISETVTTKHHDVPKYVISSGSTQRIEPAPFKNHDDEELLLLETLVGRTTPFIVPGGVNRSRRNYY